MPWQTGAANWIHDDHLELWLGQLGGYFQHCIGRETSPSQWGIRIGDGRVFQGAGPGERRHEVVARRELPSWPRAEMALIESGLAAKTLKPLAAIERLEKLRAKAERKAAAAAVPVPETCRTDA